MSALRAISRRITPPSGLRPSRTSKQERPQFAGVSGPHHEPSIAVTGVADVLAGSTVAVVVDVPDGLLCHPVAVVLGTANALARDAVVVITRVADLLRRRWHALALRLLLIVVVVVRGIADRL